MNEPIHRTTDPEVLSWPEMQKKAEREGVDISDFVTSMHAHILNQRDALARQGKQIERLQKEVQTYRSGFEGALRYVAEEVYDDVRAPFDPKAKGFTPEYRNDLASMRAARALLP